MADPRDEVSPMGSSAAACFEAAPYQDTVEEDQRRIGRHNKSTPIYPPKETDAVKPRTCSRCGLQVPPIQGGVHKTADDCIEGLRDLIAMEAFNTKLGRVKRRAAAAR